MIRYVSIYSNFHRFLFVTKYKIVPRTRNPVGLRVGMPPANRFAKSIGVRAAIEFAFTLFTVPLELTGVFGESILSKIKLEHIT